MPSPLRRKQSNSSGETQRPQKKFKTTGDDFVLRKLTYFRDKKDTNDEIHETIELCPVSTTLVDTEVFQRLRNINQLANAEYIYMCANHNRFQHSLGVAHLAEKMCKSIKEEQPQLGATDKDVLCVKLAGLLHDLGHGPYSHLYESFRDNYLPKFLKAHPELNEAYTDCEHLKTIEDWAHEESSLLFIDSMLEELGLQIDLNNLDKPLRQINHGIDANSMRVFKPPGVQDAVLTSRDFVFIKECIIGKPLEGFSYFIGRQDKKLEWLYDIVSNRHNGLDVDKIDYFARDHTRTIGKRGIDMKMVTEARVAKGLFSRPEKGPTREGKSEPGMHYMICYPEKHITTAMNFFKHRMHMHKTVYQHKTTTAVETMVCDLLCHADPFFRLRSIDGEKFPISRAYLKSKFLVRLDDSVLTLITHSTDQRLAKARELCERLRRRDLYKCAINQTLQVDNPILDLDDLEGQALERAQGAQRDIAIWEMSESEIHNGMVNLMNDVRSKDKNAPIAKLNADDFIVKKYTMHHGAGSKNPLMRMRFFDKMSREKLIGPAEDLPMAKQADESRYQSVIPNEFRCVGVRVVVPDNSKQDEVITLFNQWYETGDTIPNPCTVEPTSLYNQFRTLDDNEDDDDSDSNDYEQGGRDFPAQLTQEYDDSDSGKENEVDDHPMFSPDVSPIPVRTRAR